MSKMKVLSICLMLLVIPTSQVSADADESNTNSEVTIGFGNVTNDTMVFTMDNSVDVYVYQVTLTWETGAVYCAISGSGGLSEEHNLYVSVLYAGCLTTGYYYGAQGTYYIPSGSNDTLTSIYYQSNSPEVCIGNATYTVMLADGEFETRQADFDPNDCLSYTRYEQEWPNDVWYVLDEDGNDEYDNESEVEEIIDDSLYQFNEDLTVLENLESFDDFSTLIEALNITGLTDNFSSNNTPQMGWTIFAPTNDAFASAGIDLDDFDSSEEIEFLTEILLYHVTFAGPYALNSGTAYNSSSGEYEPHCQPYTADWVPMLNGEYADPFDNNSWTETVTISNDCLGNVTVNQANIIDADNLVYGELGLYTAEDYGMIQVIDQVLIPTSFNFTPPNNDEPRFNPRFDIPSNLENDGEFGDLMDALGMTMLMDDINIENSPQMGMTIFAPTDEAFAAAGINLDDYDSLQKLEGLSEILLNHVSFDWVLSFPDECTPTELDMETTDSFSITISNDCEGNIFVNEAKILYSQGVENGVIIVIDQVLMTIEEEPVEEPVEEPEEIVDDVLSNDLATVGDGNTAQTNLENPISKNAAIIGFGILFVMISVLLGTASLKGKKSQRINLGSTNVISTGKANELFQLLSKSKMIQILNILHSDDNPLRFTELKNRLDTSSTTLSRRLGELEEYDLVKRTVYDTVPSTVAYELTNLGVSLLPSLDSFFDWVGSQ